MLAWDKSASQRARGWAGETSARSKEQPRPHPKEGNRELGTPGWGKVCAQSMGVVDPITSVVPGKMSNKRGHIDDPGIIRTMSRNFLLALSLIVVAWNCSASAASIRSWV